MMEDDDGINAPIACSPAPTSTAILSADAPGGLKSNERILLAACVAGDELLVRALVKLGVDLDVKTPNGLSPLVVAIVNGHVAVVELLLSNGAAVCLRSVIPAVTLAGKSGSPGVVPDLLRIIGTYHHEFVCSALVFAVAEGCSLTVLELLRLGADPNTVTASGLHPLIVASERGQADMVRLLIQAGANVQWVSGSQLTPLAVAARNGHPAVVSILLEAGPTTDAIDTALVFAGKMGHMDVVDLLLQAGWRLCTKFGPSALRLAVMDGCDAVIQRLIASGVNVDDRSPKGLTAILAASERGMEGAVRQLITARADVTGVSDGGLTPLVVASVNGHSGVVQQLLSAGADVCTTENISAIVLAGKHGHRAVVEQLIEAGVRRKEDFHSFALLFAIAEGCTVTMRILLDAGADVNQTNKDGTTALMAASERGCAEVVHLLLQAGAKVNAVAYNLTALAVASRNGHRAVVKHLLDAGADIATFDTALLFAGKNSHFEVVEEIIRAGHQRTFQPGEGRSTFCEGALRLAISSNCKCAVECLLRYGTAVNDGLSPPPLMIASERGLTDIVKLLVEAGANPNTSTGNGLSALVVAAVNGHTAVVKQLLAAGAKVSAGDNIQAIVLAGKYGHFEVVEALIHAGQQEHADFSKALLSAIVDDCQVVVAKLLQTGACSVQSDNDMPLRLAFYQQRRNIVAQLLAARANWQESYFTLIFGTNQQLLDLLSNLAHATASDFTGLSLELMSLIHPIASSDSPPSAAMMHISIPAWWETGERPTACFLPCCPGLPDTSLGPFLQGLNAFKRHADLPCFTDGLGSVLCHASHSWHERYYGFLPLSCQKLVRLVLLLWTQRQALPGISFDLLRVVFGYTIVPEVLVPG